MTGPAPTPRNRLYAWYGDDFTGSTDVLEALALYAVKAVLFTRTPDEHALATFADCRAIGMAGESRSRDPEWMDRNLPAIFHAMRKLEAPVNHYKVCSTFDSSPQTGSIGRAMELGLAAFDADFVPVVVGAPHLGRAVVFGNLFAAYDNEMYRIDRHPAMRHHPVTPMTEADLRAHLSKQTKMQMGGVELNAFQGGAAGARLSAELKAGAQAVVFDGCDDAMLDETAQLLCERAHRRPVFAVGSSGLTHGLLRFWRGSAQIGAVPAPARAAAVDRLLVLSGSCSPATAAQIGRAQQLGFSAIHLLPASEWPAQTAQACAALQRGQSVVLYTALGPQTRDEEHGEAFGVALGRMLRALVLASGVRRVLIAGGDTATHAVKQLGLDALTFAAPLASGVPLCCTHAGGSPLEGLELALKGGQIGPEDFFARVRDGG